VTVILLRHGESTANVSGSLAGRTPGVGLTDRGQAQAAAAAERLAKVSAIVRSPMLRCELTVAPLVELTGLAPVVEDDLSEVDYGEWTLRPIKELVSEPLWKIIQRHPSGAVFPGGEGLLAMQRRAVDAIKRLDKEFGPENVWVACTHADVIKAILADALGLHFDGYQRLYISPGSLSVVRYTDVGPLVLRMNDGGADLGLGSDNGTVKPGG
jgi:probable phosphomutase (TIGR03848 family)